MEPIALSYETLTFDTKRRSLLFTPERIELLYQEVQRLKKEEAEKKAATLVTVTLPKGLAERLRNLLAWNVSLPQAIQEFADRNFAVPNFSEDALTSQEMSDIQDRLYRALEK